MNANGNRSGRGADQCGTRVAARVATLEPPLK